MTIHEFVAQARLRNVQDETIRRSLSRAGWNDDAIDTALLEGLEVPAAEITKKSSGTSTGALFSALHHVLLWFFVIAASIATASAIGSLLGESVSEDALASFIAVSVITFIPYATVFWLYLRARKSTPGLVPGKIWSIITICLASIGVMITLMTAVVSLITDSSISVLASAGALFLIYASVVIIYAQASFARSKTSKRSSLLLWGPLAGIALLMLGLFVASVLQLGPARHDANLRTELVEAAESVRSYAERMDTLPASGTDITLGSDVEYTKLTDTTYRLCAPFKIDTTANNSRSTDTIDDAFISDYYFYGSKTDNCFVLENSHIERTRSIDLRLNSFR